jgi:hypothetical protein
MAKRVEREIEEILSRLNDAKHDDKGVAPPPVYETPPQVAYRHGFFWRNVAAIPMSQVMTWSLLIVITAFFLRAIPGAGWLMLGALIVFVVALSLRLATPSGTSSEPGWLSQPVDEWAPSWLRRVKDWLQALKKQ